MWFKWKRSAVRLEQELRTLQSSHAEQSARVAALEQQLQVAEAASQQRQRQLDYYRGVSEKLIRFSTSVAHLGESFEFLTGQLGDNKARAGEVAAAALSNQKHFGELQGKAAEMEEGLGLASRKVDTLAERSQEIDPAPRLRPRAAVTDMSWHYAGDRRALGEALMRKRRIAEGDLTHCYTCHR